MRTTALLALPLAAAILAVAGCSPAPAKPRRAAASPAVTLTPACRQVIADTEAAGYAQAAHHQWNGPADIPRIVILGRQLDRLVNAATFTDHSAQLGGDLSAAGLESSLLEAGHGSLGTWDTDLAAVLDDCDRGD